MNQTLLFPLLGVLGSAVIAGLVAIGLAMNKSAEDRRSANNTDSASVRVAQIDSADKAFGILWQDSRDMDVKIDTWRHAVEYLRCMIFILIPRCAEAFLKVDGKPITEESQRAMEDRLLTDTRKDAQRQCGHDGGGISWQ
jgi:hypothetical protein